MFTRSLYFYNVTVLGPDGVIGRSLRIKGRRVAALDGSPRWGDMSIDGQGGLLIPGLINAHDHLELNTFQRLKYRERYSHSVEWIEDIEARFETDPALVEPRRQPLADRLLIGAMKNLLSGVTTVCHHNPLHKPLRRNYPIRVVNNYGFCHSLFRGDDPASSYQNTKRRWPWIIHLAEGVDDAAAAEFDQLAQMGAVGPNSVLVHGVGLTQRQRRLLIERGGGLIWCPGSNHFMFAQTAPVGELSKAGKLALGSDSRLSGEFDLLAELRVADQTNQISPKALYRAVTVDAARMLRLRQGGMGRLKAGGAADLVLLPAPVNVADYFASLLDLSRSRLKLVMLNGKPLVGSPQMQPVFEATRTPFAPVSVDGSDKLLARALATRLKKSSVQEPGVEVGEW